MILVWSVIILTTIITVSVCLRARKRQLETRKCRQRLRMRLITLQKEQKENREVG